MDTTNLSVGLVVGAGGPTGGPFIEAALAVVESRTGWERSRAARIVGTSAGAFVASRVRPPMADAPGDEPDETIQRLRELSNVTTMEASSRTRAAQSVRLGAGRILAIAAPTGREQALYDVADGPYHPGAGVVTVERRWGQRREHTLVDHRATVTDLVRASAAIPFANGPIRINGRLHVDGAVHSANNVDLLDPAETPVVVVVAPMVPASGGSTVSRFHRWQLFEELRPWSKRGRDAVVIMPSESDHRRRTDRDFFRGAGTRAAERLFAND